MYRVVISEPAEGDMQQAHDWWAENRSSKEAALWFDQIMITIDTLKEMPDRCPVSPLNDIAPADLHELHFGVSSRRTHRIIFKIEENTVTILRVRHHAQRELPADDLSS